MSKKRVIIELLDVGNKYKLSSDEFIKIMSDLIKIIEESEKFIMENSNV